MGEDTVRFKGCLIHGMKRGGGGNSQRMRCRAQGSGPMAGEAGAALGGGGSHRRGAPLLRCGRRKKRLGGPSGAKRPNRLVGDWAGWAEI
jgi:hypothetical protein